MRESRNRNKNKLSSFYYQVYQITKKIPRGKVVTYKAIADALGNPRASRAVGNALNKNPFAPEVPCHRVVRSGGYVGGFASGTKKKITMLRREGVHVEKGKIDLKKYGFRVK